MMPAMPVPPVAIPDRPILVVDDDAKIVRLVRTYLERDGFGVVTAADGPAALDAIERHRPALVVLDLMLPAGSPRSAAPAIAPPRSRRRELSRDRDPDRVGGPGRRGDRAADRRRRRG